MFGVRNVGPFFVGWQEKHIPPGVHSRVDEGSGGGVVGGLLRGRGEFTVDILSVGLLRGADGRTTGSGGADGTDVSQEPRGVGGKRHGQTCEGREGPTGGEGGGGRLRGNKEILQGIRGPTIPPPVPGTRVKDLVPSFRPSSNRQPGRIRV